MEESPPVVDIHNLLVSNEAGTLTYLCSKYCTKLSHFSDVHVETKLIDSLKEGNITNRIAGLVAHTSQAQSAQNNQPGSQPAKQNLEEQHTPTSKKQKRAAPLSVVIGYKSQPRTRVPMPRGGKIVHLVVRGTPSSVAKQILKHPNYSSKMVEEIGKMIKKELTTLCSDNANSMLLGSNNKYDLMQFTWDQFLPEVYNHLNYWKWILVRQPDAYFRAIDPAAPL
uniref:Uncharacterized protein n=1 Tax=Amphimedon queenslandica TaxID=400682 RepID=A0A1X7SZ01_AMPQE